MSNFSYQWRLNATGVSVALLLASIVYSSTPHAETIKHKVDIADFTYSVKRLSVEIGDTVEWINNDIVPHTATAKNEAWDTGLIAPRASVLLEIKSGMSGEYYCTYHPMMWATLVVVE